MVDDGSRSSIRWALGISGVVGLICAAAMLPVTLAEYGKSSAAVPIAARLSFWAHGAPPAGLSMLVMGFLCALLLIAGRWPMKVCAAAAAAWFIYAQAAYSPDGRWAQQMAQTFDMTPFYLGALVSMLVLLAVSVLALVTAAWMKGSFDAPGDTT